MCSLKWHRQHSHSYGWNIDRKNCLGEKQGRAHHSITLLLSAVIETLKYNIMMRSDVRQMVGSLEEFRYIMYSVYSKIQSKFVVTVAE